MECQVKVCGARQGKNKQKHIIQYQYLIKVLKWKLEFVVAVVAGDVAPRKTTRRLIRRTHISATDKRQQLVVILLTSFATNTLNTFHFR